MARIIIFAVLCIASVALAEFDYNSTCGTLNVIKNKTHLLTPREFSTKLETCRDASNHDISFTDGAFALLEVYKAIDKKKTCTFTSDMEEELIKCVTSVTGFKKNEFTARAAKEHFGLNTTEAVLFNNKQCKKSVQLSHCVEDKFSAEKRNRELKECKNNIVRGFNVTALLCQEYLIHLDRNSGLTGLPSNTLILGTAAMLAKLAIFSRY